MNATTRRSIRPASKDSPSNDSPRRTDAPTGARRPVTDRRRGAIDGRLVSLIAATVAAIAVVASLA